MADPVDDGKLLNPLQQLPDRNWFVDGESLQSRCER
jgi:hypothetical protein